MSLVRGRPLDLALELGLPTRVGELPGILAALVGGGGKTSALFAIAAAARSARVILTTTTHIRNPEFEADRDFAALVLDPRLAAPASSDGELGIDANRHCASYRPRPGGGALVLASGMEKSGGLEGMDPGRAHELCAFADLVLVEADGSRGLPVKAPAAHEPATPPDAELVVALVGLDCLGAPLDEKIAHRPELLAPMTGAAPGQEIDAAHLLALARSPRGLFKNSPAGARRVLVLNKAELVRAEILERLVGLFAMDGSICDLLLACSLRDKKIFARMEYGKIDYY